MILDQNVWVYIVYILVRKRSFVHIASHRGVRNMKTSVTGLLLLLGAALAWFTDLAVAVTGHHTGTWLIQPHPNYIVGSLLVLTHARPLLLSTLLASSLLVSSEISEICCCGRVSEGRKAWQNCMYVYTGCRKRTWVVIPMTMGYFEGRRTFVIRRGYAISPETPVFMLAGLWSYGALHFSLGEREN